MSDILAAVVGGFLAAGTGWFLQYRLEASRLKRFRELMLVAAKDDLKLSAELYDRILDEWDKSQTVWFTTLNEIRESRQTYLKNREWITMIKDESLRQKLFRYYHRSSDHLNLLENQQQRKYAIQAKLNDIVRDIHLRSPELTRDVAFQQGVAPMQAEDQELVGINGYLPQNIHRVRDFKGEAKELLSSLSAKSDV